MGSRAGARWLLVVFLLTLFEGAIRKWVVPGSPALRYAAYFAKDVAFLFAALAGAQDSRWVRRAIGLLLPASTALLFLPVVVNLSRLEAVGAFLSLRSFLLLPVCCILAANSVRSLRDVDRIVLIVGFSTILIATLGVVQYSLPASHVLNRYDRVSDEVSITAQYGHVRATGTFAYITGMGIMAGVGAWAGLYLFFISAANWRQRGFSFAVIVAGLCCAMVSMSRGGALLWAAVLLGGVALARRRGDSFYLVAALLPVFCYFRTGSDGDVDPGIQGGLVARFEKSDTATSRLGDTVAQFKDGLLNHPLGEGLGSGQIGGHFASTGVATAGEAYEYESGRLGYEVGILGWIGVMLWPATALGAILATLKASHDIRVTALCAASVPLFGLLALNHMAFNHTGSSFGWAIAALTFAAARIAETLPSETGAGRASSAMRLSSRPK